MIHASFSKYIVLLAVSTCCSLLHAQQEPPPVITGTNPMAPVVPHLSQLAVSQLPPLSSNRAARSVRLVPRQQPPILFKKSSAAPPNDPVVQLSRGRGQTPALFESFEGISFTGSAPPDTVGDVGPNHYVQMVNTVFAIFDKKGNLQTGPSLIDSLWSGAGGNCDGQNAGDPVVLYDPLADRWLISQFARPATQCIAISTGSDPTGTYHLYEFAVPAFPDYPKFAVWPDAYYMGANSNPRAFAFDRASMLNGNPASAQNVNIAAIGLHSLLLPSDLDGANPPPPGAPNYFYRFIDGDLFGRVDRIELFEYHIDFETPANSTFTGPINIVVANFNSLCDFSFDCIQQKNTSQKLDSVTEWPMWRFQYRNFGTHESLVGNYSVDVGSNQAGIRWFELRKVGAGAWSLHQQGTFSPDLKSRWMGSIAADRQGNIALGYNVSSSSSFPSIHYTGRMVDDTPGTMTLGEGTLVAGGGSQTGTNRWGDYSAMSVDPVDDCTFWYTGEYYQSTGSYNWRTRIGSFRLCQGAPHTKILWPPDGASIQKSASIGFLGTATDSEDGDLTDSLIWTSSLDGNIGTGGEFVDTLSAGVHTITVSSTDSSALESIDSITLNIKHSGCSDHVVLNEPVVGSQIAEARLSVSTWSGFSVSAGGSIVLRAGETVFLRDGTSVVTGGIMTVEIDPGVCP